jgi:diguanylate cyclase (GGDEF)-like protein
MNSRSIRFRFLSLSIINFLIAAIVAWLVRDSVQQALLHGYKVRMSATTTWFISFLFIFGILNLITYPLIVSPIRRLSEKVRNYTASGISERDLAEIPELRSLVATFVEILDSMQREKEIARAMYEKSLDRARGADIDQMTKLYNKQFLHAILRLEILRCQMLKDEFAIVMIDIDNFKHYNDVYGHLAGDKVLIKFADLLRVNTRSLDMCFRYGGEEFTVLLTRTPEQRAIAITERIRNLVEVEKFPHEEKEPARKITASFGIALYPRHGATVDELIQNADKALMRAKQLGKNRVCVLGQQ